MLRVTEQGEPPVELFDTIRLQVKQSVSVITQWRHVLTLTPILLRDIAAFCVPPVTQLLTVCHTLRVATPLLLLTVQYVGVGSDRSSASPAAPVNTTSTSDTQGRYSESPIYGNSCGEMDIWPVTYCAGHMACHLLPWKNCRSFSGMDTWSVTYWAGHIVGHLLGWTHGPSLTALDTWPVTYCTRHIVGHFV